MEVGGSGGISKIRGLMMRDGVGKRGCHRKSTTLIIQEGLNVNGRFRSELFANISVVVGTVRNIRF